MRRFLQDKRHPALDFLKYVGPGLIVAVGFIDPGNWAANLAAGSQFGYKLLWVITLSIKLCWRFFSIMWLTWELSQGNVYQKMRPNISGPGSVELFWGQES